MFQLFKHPAETVTLEHTLSLYKLVYNNTLAYVDIQVDVYKLANVQQSIFKGGTSSEAKSYQIKTNKLVKNFRFFQFICFLKLKP